jgi:hypothetical protein
VTHLSLFDAAVPCRYVDHIARTKRTRYIPVRRKERFRTSHSCRTMCLTEEARQGGQNDRSGFQGQKRLSGHGHLSGWVTKDGGAFI